MWVFTLSIHSLDLLFQDRRKSRIKSAFIDDEAEDIDEAEDDDDLEDSNFSFGKQLSGKDQVLLSSVMVVKIYFIF